MSAVQQQHSRAHNIGALGHALNSNGAWGDAGIGLGVELQRREDQRGMTRCSQYRYLQILLWMSTGGLLSEHCNLFRACSDHRLHDLVQRIVCTTRMICNALCYRHHTALIAPGAESAGLSSMRYAAVRSHAHYTPKRVSWRVLSLREELAQRGTTLCRTLVHQLALRHSMHGSGFAYKLTGS
jgi:hypothetical protein